MTLASVCGEDGNGSSFIHRVAVSLARNCLSLCLCVTLQDLVHMFQTDPEVRIAALSIEAASFVSNVPGTILKRAVRNG